MICTFFTLLQIFPFYDFFPFREMSEKYVGFDYGDEDKLELFVREYPIILDTLEPNIAVECRADDCVYGK
jgi:hypothetical protein